MRKALIRFAPMFAAVLALLIVPATAEAATSQASAAAANYPSGCATYAYGNNSPNIGAGTDWQKDCWVGSGYLTNAMFIAGIQVINADWRFNSGGRDGQYGPNTENGIKSFQTNRGLTADGVVGSDTWWNYGDVLFFTGTGPNYWTFSVSGDPYSNRFLKANYVDANNHFGNYSLRCGETSFVFGTSPYPNPSVPCV
jgi:hypothetical protein